MCTEKFGPKHNPFAITTNIISSRNQKDIARGRTFCSHKIHKFCETENKTQKTQKNTPKKCVHPPHTNIHIIYIQYVCVCVCIKGRIFRSQNTMHSYKPALLSHVHRGRTSVSLRLGNQDPGGGGLRCASKSRPRAWHSCTNRNAAVASPWAAQHRTMAPGPCWAGPPAMPRRSASE